MLKIFVRSARTPVNMLLLRKTSRETSLLKPSMVPGLLRPNLARRSEKELTASPIALARGLVRSRADNESIAAAMTGKGLSDFVMKSAV